MHNTSYKCISPKITTGYPKYLKHIYISDIICILYVNIIFFLLILSSFFNSIML